jgi:hypothetical protein
MTPTKWKGSHNLVEKEKEKRYQQTTTCRGTNEQIQLEGKTENLK